MRCSQDISMFGTTPSTYFDQIGILLPKLFGPSVRKNCSSDRKKLLKFAKFLISLEQFIQIVKGQNNFW